MDASALVGSWRLASWRALSENDGGTVAVSYPIGTDGQGLIHYGADGRMSVLLAAADRKEFASDDLMGGSVEEKVAAFGSFIAYAGGYSVGDGFVTHELEMCSFPNWVGTEQLRYVRLEGDQLVLSTDPIVVARSWQRQELTWMRIVDDR